MSLNNYSLHRHSKIVDVCCVVAAAGVREMAIFGRLVTFTRRSRAPLCIPASLQIGSSVARLTTTASASHGSFLNEAFKLFDQMLHRKWRHFSLSIISYTQLLGAVAKMGHYSSVLALYRRMMMGTVTVHPNLYTYNVLINSLCHLNKVDSAFSVLGHIFRSGYQPNVVTFTSLINGLCLENKVLKAMELFRIAENMGGAINVVTYGAMIDGLCKSAKVHMALELLKEMEDKQKDVPNFTVYSPIIYGFCKQGLLDEGLQLFSKMKDKGISADVITYSFLIHRLCSLGRFPEANAYLREMPSSGISPNVITFNILIGALCKERMAEKSRGILALTCLIDPILTFFTGNYR